MRLEKHSRDWKDKREKYYRLERHLREEKCILQSPLYCKYRLEQFCNAHRFFTDFMNCVVLSYLHTTVAQIGQIYSFTLATRQQE